MTIQVIDSPDPHRVALNAKALKAQGLVAAILYISPINITGSKTVRRDHIDALHDEGIDVGFVCEGWGGSNNFAHNDINAVTGTRDGMVCGDYLAHLGAPTAVAVMPTVDNDASPTQIKTLCIPYFTAFRVALPKTYRMGAYGCGALLFALEPLGIIDFPWLSNAMGWSRSHEYEATNRWAILQKRETKLLGIDIDPDVLNPARNEFGFWRANAAAQTGIDPPGKPPAVPAAPPDGTQPPPVAPRGSAPPKLPSPDPVYPGLDMRVDPPDRQDSET